MPTLTNPPGGSASAVALTDRVLVSQGAVDRSATLLQIQTAVGAGGSGGLTAASVRAATGERVYNVRAEFGGTFDGSPHPLSEVYGSNLQAAQAAFPLVTGLALTDYQDWAAIQQAINTAALNNKGGVVALYSGEVAVINKQIDLYPANCVSLKGFPRAIIRTESCGTTAALLVRESYEAWPVHAVENIDFQALNFGRGGASPVTAGTAVAGAAPGAGGLTWRTGATAILYRHCYNVVTSGCCFYQYDLPVQFDGDTWLIKHRDCVFTAGNLGISYVPITSPSNSGENLTWENCTGSNNNYNLYVVPDPFFAAAAVTIWVTGGSLDYANVNQFYYRDDAAGNFYTLGSLKMRDIYIETNEAVSGTVVRGFVQGNLSMDGCHIFHNGGAEPPAQIEAAGAFAWISVSNNKVLSPGHVPMVYNGGGGTLNVRGFGNYYIDNTAFLLWQTASGRVWQRAGTPRSIGNSDVQSTGTYAGAAVIDESSYDGYAGFYNSSPINVAIKLDTDGYSPFDNSVIALHTHAQPVTVVPVTVQSLAIPAGYTATIPPYSVAFLKRYTNNQYSLGGTLTPAGMATLTDGATITWATGGAAEPLAKVTLAGNRTLAMTGSFNGQIGTLIVKQDATGGRTLALPATSIKSGTPATTGNAVNRYDFIYDGTTYYWEIVPSLA
jgi:hypothetical protein